MDISTVEKLHQLAASQPALGDLVALVAEMGIFLLPLGLLAAWFGARASGERHRRSILVGCCAALVAMVVGLILERTLHRPRPFVELGITPLFPHAADSSFPSDHVLVGVALVGPLVRGAPRWGAGLLAWALIVGVARVAAGVHYPSDVAGSAILALVVDLLVWQTGRSVFVRLNLRRWGGGWDGSPPAARQR